MKQAYISVNFGAIRLARIAEAAAIAEEYLAKDYRPHRSAAVLPARGARQDRKHDAQLPAGRGRRQRGAHGGDH